MRFIGIFLLLISFHSHAVDREMSPGSKTDECQPALSAHDQSGQEEPETMRSSAGVTPHRIVKKLTGISTVPGTILILSHAKDVSAAVIMAAGVHIKNYLRHIYPAMHYW